MVTIIRCHLAAVCVILDPEHRLVQPVLQRPVLGGLAPARGHTPEQRSQQMTLLMMFSKWSDLMPMKES